MKNFLTVLTAVLVSAAAFSEEYCEFNDNSIFGTVNTFANTCMIVQEKDGNNCLKLYPVNFLPVKDKKNLVRQHVMFCLGGMKLMPVTEYSFQFSYKGTLPNGKVVLWEQTGATCWNSVSNPKYEFPLTPTDKWQVCKGKFITRKVSKATYLTFSFQPIVAKGAKPEDHYLMIDKVRLVRTADKTAENIFTLRSYLAPKLEKIKPKQPGEYLIVFKGNSITRHGYSKDTIARLGWDHLAGMAATKEELDYVHLTKAKIQSVLKDKKVRIEFASGGRSMLNDLDVLDALNADLIVYQGGEHFWYMNEYNKYLVPFAKRLKSFKSKPVIIFIGVWSPTKGKAYTGNRKEMQDRQRQIATESGFGFVSVEKAGCDPKCSGWGKSGGVKWHPNDAGMRMYAEGLFAEWKRMTERK